MRTYGSAYGRRSISANWLLGMRLHSFFRMSCRAAAVRAAACLAGTSESAHSAAISATSGRLPQEEGKRLVGRITGCQLLQGDEAGADLPAGIGSDSAEAVNGAAALEAENAPLDSFKSGFRLFVDGLKVHVW